MWYIVINFVIIFMTWLVSYISINLLKELSREDLFNEK